MTVSHPRSLSRHFHRILICTRCVIVRKIMLKDTGIKLHALLCLVFEIKLAGSRLPFPASRRKFGVWIRRNLLTLKTEKSLKHRDKMGKISERRCRWARADALCSLSPLLGHYGENHSSLCVNVSAPNIRSRFVMEIYQKTSTVVKIKYAKKSPRILCPTWPWSCVVKALELSQNFCPRPNIRHTLTRTFYICMQNII